MTYDLLLERIDERLKAVRISERKACLMAQLDPGAVQRIRNGHAPRAGTLVALAGPLQCPADYLLSALSEAGDRARGYPVEIGTVFVRGFVEAGTWREAIEWEAGSWYPIAVPADERFPRIERFALEVRGASMNRLYPDGSVVVCVRYGDLGRGPEDGERVICLRRSATGDFEATIKEYRKDERGRHLLWPRSDDPEFQAPIILDVPELPLTDLAPSSWTVSAGALPDTAGVGDLMIAARVIQSVRRE